MTQSAQAVTAGFQRSLPRLDDLNRHFWTGGAQGQLLVLHCQDCGHWLHPAGPVCPSCFSKILKPEAVSGKGTVFSFTINAKAWAPGMEVPYVIAVVALNEQPGLQLLTNLKGVAPEAVRIGMPVEVFFEQDEDVWMPMFRPAA